MRLISWHPSVRMRMILMASLLIVAAGIVLLSVNYAITARSLERGTQALRRNVERQLNLVPGLLFPRDVGGSAVVLPRIEGGGRVAGIVVPAPFASEELPSGTMQGPIEKNMDHVAERVPVASVLDTFESELRADTLNQMVTGSLVALALLAGLAVAVAMIVARRFLRPVHEITTTARRLSERDLHERIALSGPPDEIKELADTFDEMLERLERAFSSQKRFVGNASHELRTPLSIIRTHIDVAEEDGSEEELRRALDVVKVVSARNEALIDKLLTLANAENAVADEPVDLDEIVRAEWSLEEPAARARGIDVSLDLAPTELRGDHILLGHLVRNLIHNSIRHNVDNGKVEIATSSGGGRTLLIVSNTGRNLTDRQCEAIFEPFHRLDADRMRSSDGAGLGLSIVRAVAEAHGGNATARPNPGGGLIVEVSLTP